MPLRKIIEIANIGCLVACKNIELQKLSLVYAENGCGKSTFSAVMRSLNQQNPQIIEERSTLGSKKQPKVKLLFNDNDFVSYENAKWQANQDYIEVFDDIFVSENIYAGHQINSDHRTGLYEFAVGSLAIKLRKEEQEYDEQIRTLDDRRRELRKIIQQVNNLQDFEAFIQLEPIDDIDDKISSLEDELDRLRSNELIQTKSSLSKLTITSIDFETYGKLLEQTVNDIAEDAEDLVKQHIENHLKDKEKAENWLETGLEQVQSDLCPFCGQHLNTELFSAYRDYFNHAYNELKNEINDRINGLSNIVSDNSLMALQKYVSDNQILIEFWNEYLKITDIDLDFEKIKHQWQSIRNNLQQLLHQKKQAPLEPISDSIETLIKTYNDIEQTLLIYNEQVERINDQIEEIKRETAALQLKEKEAELTRTQQIKQRFTISKNDCDEFIKLDEEKDELSKLRKKAKENLDNANEQILNKYRNSINDYLERFGVDFKLKTDIDRRGGGRPRLMLKVVINDDDVDISSNVEDGEHNFKNTLSTGDKTTLALAFFFARLQQMDQERLQKTIVILDDPITSLGMHRRERTAHEIYLLANKARQLILLSHEPYFIRDVYRKIEYIEKPKLLQLASPKNQTQFLDWDMYATLKSKFYSRCEMVADFEQKGSGGDRKKLENVRISMRLVLEAALQNRFPLDLSESDSLGIHISNIIKANKDSRLVVIKNNEKIMNLLDEVNQYSSDSHHIESIQTLTSEKQLASFARDVLRFVHGELG